jgi:hypothetical protein
MKKWTANVKRTWGFLVAVTHIRQMQKDQARNRERIRNQDELIEALREQTLAQGEQLKAGRVWRGALNPEERRLIPASGYRDFESLSPRVLNLLNEWRKSKGDN